VILRIWRAKIALARREEYLRFEGERCLPMLLRQLGFLGVLFVRQGEDRAASLTIWEDRGAVGALASSPSYGRTARELAESDLLAGKQLVEVFEGEGGHLRPDALLRALGL
jgi:heme-degrading monooxygenase HmoA